MLCQIRCAIWLRIRSLVPLIVISVVSLAQIEPVAVVRSPEGDLVRLARPDGVCVNGTCPPEAPTYLVGEEMPCVDKVEALGDCNVQLVPRVYNFSITDSIQSFIAENGSLMVLDSATNQYGVGRLFSLQGTRQRGSNCRVTGLTLLRGNEVLSHQGFSVTSGREITIMVDEEHLAYPKEDYDGEVFHMNISCSDNSQVNCVVFKLNGTTDLTEEKFDLQVSPQVLNVTYSCFDISPLTSTTPTSTTNIFDDPILQIITIVSACGVGVLLCLILSVSAVGCYFHHKSKKFTVNESKPEELKEVNGELFLNCNLAYGVHKGAVKDQPKEEDQTTSNYDAKGIVHEAASKLDTQSLLYEAVDKPHATGIVHEAASKSDTQSLLYEAVDKPHAKRTVYDTERSSSLYESVDKPGAQPEIMHDTRSNSDTHSLYESVDKPGAQNKPETQSLLYEAMDKPDAHEKVVIMPDTQSLLYEEMDHAKVVVKPDAQSQLYEAMDKPDAHEKVVVMPDTQSLLYEEMDHAKVVVKPDAQSQLYEAMDKPAAYKETDKLDPQKLLYEAMDRLSTDNTLDENKRYSDAHNLYESVERQDALEYDAVDKPNPQSLLNTGVSIITQLQSTATSQHEAVHTPDSQHDVRQLDMKAKVETYDNPSYKIIGLPQTKSKKVSHHEIFDDDINLHREDRKKVMKSSLDSK